MSFDKTWCTLDEAAEKFGLEKKEILKWVEDGLVRSENSGDTVARVHLDDLDLKIQEKTGI